MLFGRVAGLLMMLFGAGMLLRDHSDDAGFWRFTLDPGADNWNFSRQSVVDYLQQTIGERLSAVLSTGWAAVALLVLGAVLFWSCRRGARQR